MAVCTWSSARFTPLAAARRGVFGVEKPGKPVLERLRLIKNNRCSVKRLLAAFTFGFDKLVCNPELKLASYLRFSISYRPLNNELC